MGDADRARAKFLLGRMGWGKWDPIADAKWHADSDAAKVAVLAALKKSNPPQAIFVDQFLATSSGEGSRSNAVDSHLSRKRESRFRGGNDKAKQLSQWQQREIRRKYLEKELKRLRQLSDEKLKARATEVIRDLQEQADTIEERHLIDDHGRRLSLRLPAGIRAIYKVLKERQEGLKIQIDGIVDGAPPEFQPILKRFAKQTLGFPVFGGRDPLPHKLKSKGDAIEARYTRFILFVYLATELVDVYRRFRAYENLVGRNRAFIDDTVCPTDWTE